MSRKLFFLIAGTLAILTIALGIFTGIKMKNLSNQYESSMDRITVIEERLVELHTTMDETP